MIDHIVLNVRDVAVSKKFYEVALAPLGYEVVMEMPGGVGFGIGGKPEFWISARKGSHSGVHIAFRGDDRSAVDAFYTAAMEVGGRDNVEAVCHAPLDAR